MKKVAPILAFLCYFSLMAQPEYRDITLAPTAGFNMSSYSGGDYKTRNSIHFGVIAEYYFSDNWSGRTGLTFEPMGAKTKDGYTDKLSFITIPLNANVHLGWERQWYVNFGPSIGFLANAECRGPNDELININDDIAPVDFGFGVGVGRMFSLGQFMQWFVDIQGYKGFVNMDKNDVLEDSITNFRVSANFGLIVTL
ncbi:PorT family protein [Mangrovimonas sp. CR14]|uniref:porin family protein n=1 Tax=Mangrovimonas sp. CR14 TaxID=2706120 RepID=UPI001421E7A4|nr:porin family protein [Mangrovimonas sp. CR14]NIK93384.1 PorT family protein [Mangrovimonas sp. CR14]